MSSDLLKEHLKAVADRLTDESKRNTKVVKPSKKSDTVRKSERANNYIGKKLFLFLGSNLVRALNPCSLMICPPQQS